MTLNPQDYREILRTDFASFIERSFRELNPQTHFLASPHIEVMAAKLEGCRRGQIRRLIINLPPRNLKSHCASIAFPAWVLGHDPAAQIICASYGQDLADKLARDCRKVMQSSWYAGLFPACLSSRQAVHDFTTTEHGTRMATSVGGVLTGRGADIIIIDDPLKPDEALSDSRRGDVNAWYDGTLLSRLNDKVRGCIIIVMQRLHQDDLVGHVQEQESWEVLSFPAIAEEDETHVFDDRLGRHSFRRAAGEPLHAERESSATLATIRATVGSYTFASQYQQSPTPVGGAMIKTEWLRFYAPAECPARFDRVVQSWDTANKATELNDYSVCTTWGVVGRSVYLLDVFRGRLNYPDLKRKVVELANAGQMAQIVIEDKASGTQLIQDLKHQVLGLVGFQPPAGMDKIMRLHAQTARFENGLVWLPRQAPWLDRYVQELTSFPGTKYDDQVDSTTQALAYIGAFNHLEVWARLAQ